MSSDPRFIELWDGARSDSSGAAMRSFRVPADTEAAAQFYADPLFPRVGELHPRIANLVCTRVGVSGRLGTDSYLVTAEYSLPGLAGSVTTPPVDHTTPLSKWQSGGTSMRAIQVPYFILKTEYTYGSAEFGPPARTTILVPTPAQVPATIRQSTFTVTCNVAQLTAGDVAGFRDQQGKLHTIGGKVYLFTGARYSQERTGSWKIDYEWLYETDTNLTGLFTGFQDNVTHIMPPINGAGSQRILPAYNWFVFGEAFVSDPPRPIIYYRPLYDSSPNGWASFPGDPTT